MEEMTESDDGLIHDVTRTELVDTVSIDFRLGVPKAPHEDLKSSVSVEEDLVEQFELRLGLLSKERYDPDEIRETMNDILSGVDLPRTRYRAQRQELIDQETEEYNLDPERIPDKDAEDEITPKLGYDPHWGEIGFFQVHLKCHSFTPPIMREGEFMDFTREFTEEFIDRFEWDE